MTREEKKRRKQEKRARKAAAQRPSAAEKTPAAGKTATGRATSSRRADKPAEKMKANSNEPKKKKNTVETEKRVLIYGITVADERNKEVFPKEFPFWARLKISKGRTTLVIDEEKEVYNKRKKRKEEGFVHREAIHPNEDGSNVKGYEKIEPNPDPTDKKDMYLKSPSKLPKRLFKPHNKNLDMPEKLKERYDKNNHKNDK